MPCQSKHITYFQLENNIASLLDLKHVNYESGQIYWDKLYNSAYYDGISWCHILGRPLSFGWIIDRVSYITSTC